MHRLTTLTLSLLSLAGCDRLPAGRAVTVDRLPTRACVETVNNMALVDWVAAHQQDARIDMQDRITGILERNGYQLVQADRRLSLLATPYTDRNPMGEEYTTATITPFALATGTATIGGRARAYTYPLFIGYEPNSSVGGQLADGRHSYGFVIASDMREQVISFDRGRYTTRVQSPPRPITAAEWQQLPQGLRDGLATLEPQRLKWQGTIAQAEEDARPAAAYLSDLERQQPGLYDNCSSQYIRMRAAARNQSAAPPAGVTR